MTKQEWFKLYDESYPKFKWFIEQYFPSTIEGLIGFREKEDFPNIYKLLSMYWYELPSNRFNIIENPEGWTEFITLLENEITD